jgi:TolB-like protein/tetratricopeptide (TPR) repeat protein/tRNA A-37 threonylcarbamoyl transferase component Bud32
MSEIAGQLAAALSGRYTVDKEIGRGGNAIVLRARDVRHDRWVALKVLRPDLSSTLGAERFFREIRLAAALQHPHILPLHDSGEAAGLLYYVMPYVEGESLRARLEREGQLPLDDALRIAREVADALHYAHQRDIVHRDIKPENILLSGGHALVADFGIARAISAAGGMKLTETGLAIGTPAYMSPEQTDTNGRIDGRADVYALGCTLYEMLIGEPPYRGPTPLSIMAQHSQTAIPLIRNVRPGVPDIVQAAVERAMAKVPADRFPTAEAFAVSLPLTTATLVATPPRRRKLALIAGIAAATVLVAGTWAGRQAWSTMRAEEPITIAVAPIRVSDTADAAFADGLTQELTNALTRVKRIAPRPYSTVVTEAARETNPLELGRKLDVEYVLATSLRRQGRQLRTSTELIRVKDGTNVWSPTSFQGSDADLFLMQERISSQLVRELAGSFAPAEATRREPDPAAYKLYLQARAVSSISAGGAEKAIAMYRSVIELDSAFAPAWAGLGWSLHNSLQYAGASPLEIVRQSEYAANRALLLDSTVAEAWIVLASMSWQLQWDFDEADRRFRRAIAMQPSDGATHIEYSKFLHTDVALTDSAIAEVRRAIRLDPTNSHNVMIDAYQLQTAGRLREADSIATRAIVLDPDNWVAYIMRGKIALKERRFADAIRACEASARMQGSENPFTMGFAGFCYGKAGDTANAQRILSALTEMSRHRYVQRAAIVWARLGAGDRAGALNDLELAANAREVDFMLLMRESAADLWSEPRYQALLRRAKLDRIWKAPPVS